LQKGECLALIGEVGSGKTMTAMLLNKLKVLETLTAEGVFTFDLASLNSYLSEYKAAGYPAVSHSEQYRQAYKPAYRIIRNAYL
jgi:ABC-type glutathione transport system ATPase component